jgi:hypothetical protein
MLLFRLVGLISAKKIVETLVENLLKLESGTGSERFLKSDLYPDSDKNRPNPQK